MIHIGKKIYQFKSSVHLTSLFALIKKAAKKWLYISSTLIVLETVFFFISFYLLKLLIDVVGAAPANATIGRHDIIKYVALAGGTGIIYFILRSFSAYAIEVQATKVAEYINRKLHERAVSLDLSFYESPAYYDMLKRATDAGADRPNLIVTTMTEVAKNTLSLFAIGSVLIVIHWLLLPILALFILPTLFVRLYFSRELNRLRIAQTPVERKSSYYSTLITTDTAAKEIRTFNLGNLLKSQFVKIRNLLVKQKLSISLRRTRLEVITTAMSYAGVFFCIGYIAVRAVTGEASVGDVTLFVVAFPQSFGLLQNISSGISIVYQNSIYIQSIFDLLELESNFREPEKPMPIPENEDIALCINNVFFTYPHTDVETLSNINLKIPSGKIIAIAGMNGAGKSTLIKLLCRLYDPVKGTITLAGTDIRNFSSKQYRSQLGVVFQDFNKYAFKAGDNIYFGDISRAYNFERIEEAAAKSGAAEFINTFPQKYETIMGRIFEDGREVSIGQWQKIAMARCFYSEARFLILDEATSALDAVSEKQLFDSFRENIGNRAAIIISHRHSAIKHADYIYVLSKGKIVEEGTDAELIAGNGAYATLFKPKNNIPGISS